MRGLPAWLGFLVLGAVASAAFVTARTGSYADLALVLGVIAAAVAAVAAGIWLKRPRWRLPWLFLLASQIVWFAGWAQWQLHVAAEGSTPSLSSAANITFLFVYPLLIPALLALLWRRERDVVAFVDVVTIAAAGTAIAWVTIVSEYIESDSTTTVHAVQTMFTVGDVLLLAVVLRLLVAAGRRSPALMMLLAAPVAFLFSNFVWNWSTALAEYTPGSWADAGWLVFSVLVGAAALHPSMREVYEREPRRTRRLEWSRLLFLAVASLVAPALHVAMGPVVQRPAVTIPVAVASGIAALSVVVRIALIVREGQHLAVQLAAQNEQLRELDRAKDDFVASVSHELRTPLTSIRGYLELMREGEGGDLTPEQDRFLEVVERNADRLLHVVGDLLLVAQIGAGQLTLERAETDLDALVEHAVEAARPHAERKGIDLRRRAGDLPRLEADPARLGQVVDNLVSNALKFTEPGGAVTVTTSARDGEAIVEVADTGIGISAEDQEQLFERFFRTTAATDQAIPGTGLGLAIVKAIVEAHGGRVVVESHKGRGTTFRVHLPLVRTLAEAAA